MLCPPVPLIIQRLLLLVSTYFLFPVIRDTAALRFPFHAPYLAVLLHILITNNIGFSLPALLAFFKSHSPFVVAYSCLYWRMAQFHLALH